LLLVGVYTIHDDAEAAADGVGLALAAAYETEADGVEQVEVILEGGDMDDAAEDDGGEFDDEAEALDIDDDGLECLGAAGAELGLEVLEFLEFDRFLLGI
jgi:hypothetical protein